MPFVLVFCLCRSVFGPKLLFWSHIYMKVPFLSKNAVMFSLFSSVSPVLCLGVIGGCICSIALVFVV